VVKISPKPRSPAGKRAEQPGQLSGSAQNFTGGGSEKTSAGNFSSSTTHTPAPRRIVWVSALSGPLPPIE